MDKSRKTVIFVGGTFVAIILVFCNIIATITVAKKTFPNVSYFGFPVRYLGDYFTNIYRIKLGQEGTILYHNAYSNEATPDVLFEPHYNIVGFLTKPFGFSPLESYELFRFIAILGFILAISALIAVAIPELEGRLLALVLFLTSTPFWKFANGVIDINAVQEPETYSDFFNVFTKINAMKAHHLVAYIVLIGICFLLTRQHITKKNVVLLFSLGCMLGFIHPYVSIYTGVFVTVYTGIRLVQDRKKAIPTVIQSIVLGVTMLPIVLYHGYVLNTYWKLFMDMAGTTVWVPREFSFSTYSFSLGAIFFLSIPIFFVRRFREQRLLQMLSIWGFVPLILFFLPDIKIPMSTYRLFQSYQQIPFSVLAPVVIVWVLRKVKINLTVGVAVISCIAILYAIPPYMHMFVKHVESKSNFFPTQKAIAASMPLLEYLQKNAPKDSVVLASEEVSLAVPIFTESKTLIGHPGTNPEYDVKIWVAYKILDGTYPTDLLLERLKMYNVRYILFGSQYPENFIVPFSQTPFVSFPFLKEKYKFGNKSVVEVIYP